MFDLCESLNSKIHAEEEDKHQNSSLALEKKLFTEIMLYTYLNGLQYYKTV